MLPEHMTYGECYDPAMKCKTKEEARAWLDQLIERSVHYFGNTPEEALRVERFNIGYWTGYCDHETAQRVFYLFDLVHPIFGGTRPTAEEAFRMGLELGSKDT